MKKFIMIVMVAAFALPAIAQSFTTDERQGVQTTNFQSTSTMQSSGSVYTPNPTIGSDGTASNPSATTETSTTSKPGGPRKIDIYTPETDPNAPVGDEMVPLLIISMLYVGYLLLRRRKEAR